MDRKCDINRKNCVVVRSGSKVAIDTEAEQGSVNGLNRTMSVSKSEHLVVAQDKSKTSNKNLRNRICELWLVRKIVDLFKKIFCSKKVVAFVNEEIAPAIVCERESCNKLSAEADSLLAKVCELDKNITANVSTFAELEKTEALIDGFVLEIDQLKEKIKKANKVMELNGKTKKTECCIKRLRKCVCDTVARNYEGVFKHYCDTARIVMKENDSQLFRLDKIVENYNDNVVRCGSCHVHSTGRLQRELFMTDMAKITRRFGNSVLELVDGIGKKEQYQNELLNRWPANLPKEPLIES